MIQNKNLNLYISLETIKLRYKKYNKTVNGEFFEDSLEVIQKEYYASIK